MKPTKAQIKEFWEWCGFEWLPKGSHDKFKRLLAVQYPDGTIRSACPDIDLNNLFNYAVPKVNKVDNELYDIQFTYNRPNGGITCDIKREIDLSQAQGDNPALALFWAIYEVIKK